MITIKSHTYTIFAALIAISLFIAAVGTNLDLPRNGDKVFGTCIACSAHGAYQHISPSLILMWGALIATVLVLGLATSYLLKRKEAVA